MTDAEGAVPADYAPVNEPQTSLGRRIPEVAAAAGLDSLWFVYHVSAITGLLFIPMFLLAGAEILLPPWSWMYIWVYWSHGESLARAEFPILGFLLKVSAIAVAVAYVAKPRPSRGMAFATRRFGTNWQRRALMFRIPFAITLVALMILIADLML